MLKSFYSHQTKELYIKRYYFLDALFMSVQVLNAKYTGIFFIPGRHVAASDVQLAAVFYHKSPVRSFRCGSFPKKVTLALATRRVSRLRCAADLLRIVA